MAYDAKYRKDGGPVDAFIASLDNPARRADAQAALALYREVTGFEPRMWGASIVGFGDGEFVYPSGTRSAVPLACFAPRKPHTTFYLHSRFEGAEALYARLGKYKKSGGCVHVTKLDNVDRAVLGEIVARSFAHMKENGPDVS